MSQVPCKNGVVIETIKQPNIMTTNQQLELGFNGTQNRIFGRRREARAARAQWWFTQMRTAVANAMDWPPTSQPPAQQIAFPGVARMAKA